MTAKYNMSPAEIPPGFAWLITEETGMERRGTTDTATIFIDEETLTKEEMEELINGKTEG